MKFLDLLSADHHAIDDEVYRELGTVFTAAQIVELGFTCANTMGAPPVHPHARRVRHQPTGDRLQPGPGRLRLRRGRQQAPT